jgi:hypothetical protein
MSDNMFELASRTRVRFSFKGLISVEDLWDLSLENLDTIFKALNTELKQAKEESLLTTRSKKDDELALKVELVKYVVKTKLEENAAKLEAKERKLKKQQIMEIMASKQDDALKTKSLEELSKMLNELD